MKLRRNTSLWGAAGVLAAMLGTAAWTWQEKARLARIHPELRRAMPTWTCPTGYDASGRCVFDDLMGGVHGFLEPGALSVCLTLVVGATLGLVLSRPSLPGRAVFHAAINGLEALPRLAVLLMVFLLSDGSLMAMGGVLGLLCAPALAHQIFERVSRLQRKSFVEAARSHGVPERRVQLYHLLWLSCRGLLLRHAAMAFGYMLVAESSFSYALQLNPSQTERSWGDQLRSATEALYASVARWFFTTSGGREAGGREAGLEFFQFLAVAGILMAVLWALHTVGELSARHTERVAWR